MRRIALLFALALFVAACGGDDADTSTTVGGDGGGDTETGDAEFAITEVVFGDTASITIANVGDGSGSLAGHFFCQRPSYDELPATELGPGESVTLVAGEDFSIGSLSAGGGEIGLYTSSNFSNSEDIVAYVEWGSDGHGRSDVAASAGIWSGFVATDDSTSSMTTNTDPATEAGHWDTA